MSGAYGGCAAFVAAMMGACLVAGAASATTDDREDTTNGLLGPEPPAAWGFDDPPEPFGPAASPAERATDDAGSRYVPPAPRLSSEPVEETRRFGVGALIEDTLGGRGLYVSGGAHFEDQSAEAAPQALLDATGSRVAPDSVGVGALSAELEAPSPYVGLGYARGQEAGWGVNALVGVMAAEDPALAGGGAAASAREGLAGEFADHDLHPVAKVGVGLRF